MSSARAKLIRSNQRRDDGLRYRRISDCVRARARAQQPYHVTRFRSAGVCTALHPDDDDVRGWSRVSMYSAYDRAYAGLHIRTYAAMCRIHVAPSRRPSDVLLGSRNSALHSYRITYTRYAYASVCV